MGIACSIMKLLTYLFSAVVVLGAESPVVPLGDTTGHVKYAPVEPDHYAPNEIRKSGDFEDCHYVDKLVYKDECVPYVEKTCYTQQEEQCHDVDEKNCTSVIEEYEKRECFEVTELVCSLVETQHYEVVQEDYIVQRCTRAEDRVCDTVFDLAITTKDDFQCVDVDYVDCWDQELVIKDRTCIFSVDFECGKIKPKDGKNSVQCDKVPTKKCYDTPRKVRQDVCKPRSSKYCEKFTNDFPYPVEKQNCHSEPMKRCELERRSKPKKAKQYAYHKQCKPVKRQVCDDSEKKRLRSDCNKVQRTECNYKPVEKCVDEKKQYCFKQEAMLHEKVCLSEKKQIIDETLSHV